MVDAHEAKQEQPQPRSFTWLSCCLRSFPGTSSRPEMPSPEEKVDDYEDDDGDEKRMSQSNQRKPGGWKSMPFIIGNETFERLAGFGLLANFLVYLKREYHMDQVSATNLINIYSGVANFGPLFGAFLSDAYIGRFWSIAIGSVAAFLGMVTLTLTSCIPSLKPTPCPLNYQKDQQLQPQLLASCAKPDGGQMGFLVLCLGLLTVGTSGIRPCSLPFGVDQFDGATEEGRRGINSYYNWYYTTFTVVVMLTLTVVVYIQDSVSWVWGFGIPTALMLCSIALFFLGRRLYVYVRPEGSVFSSILRAFVAAYKKRRVVAPPGGLPEGGAKGGAYYDPPPPGVRASRLALTDEFRCLNKAALIQEGELNIEGTPNPTSKWTLCSVQEVEEVKCLLRVLPIWASGVVCFTAAAQTSTFTISQAMVMNRHVGPRFVVPPGSIMAVSMLAVGVWVPLYDRLVVPALRRATGHEEGITLLQRIGAGLALSILAMLVAGLVEGKRRDLANTHQQTLSVVWLFPQLGFLGLAEGFNFIGQIEFYNKQFPEKLSSLATSLFFVTVGGANYLSAAVIGLVHGLTGGPDGQPDWLTDDINRGRVDYFYYLLAVMGVVNFLYFLVVARRYRYKGSSSTQIMLEGDKGFTDLELSSVKQ